jgi:pyruvate,water dikinase
VVLVRQARGIWQRSALPSYVGLTHRWEAEDLAHIPAARLLGGAHEIVATAARHYLIIRTGILPQAFVTDGLFTAAYDRFVKRRGDPPAVTFLLGFDSAPIRAERSLYDLARWARVQPGLVAYVVARPGAELATALDGPAPEGVDEAAWLEFARRFSAHLAEFGHAVYDLDFARSLPADDPAPLLDALRYFLSGQAADPQARQAEAAAHREVATRAVLARLRGPRRALFRRLLEWAQRFAPLREDALAEVGRGWPVLRRMLRELGRRLVAAGALDRVDDVFWLTDQELGAAAAALDAGSPAEPHQSRVAERRTTWEGQRRLTPPVYLPLRGGATFMGVDWSRFMPVRTGAADAGNGAPIGGIGTSPGRVTGIARVLRGPDEFGLMQPGEILVAKITTPAWTPLFALAAGVVTDVGGPLSHGSIVAREYHIPAVLGTGVATERIRSGQRITVDGDAGTVQVIA